jgi:hypothetical protein
MNIVDQPEGNRLNPRQLENFCRRVRHPKGPLGKWGCWVWQGDREKAGTLTYGRFVYTTRGKERRYAPTG